MNKATITKVINKVNRTIEMSKTDSFYKATLGFHRLTALPKRVRQNFDLAANLENNWDGAKALVQQKEFLENLTDTEFKTWLKTV